MVGRWTSPSGVTPGLGLLHDFGATNNPTTATSTAADPAIEASRHRRRAMGGFAAGWG
jgi:hypothetical protein